MTEEQKEALRQLILQAREAALRAYPDGSHAQLNLYVLGYIEGRVGFFAMWPQ